MTRHHSSLPNSFADIDPFAYNPSTPLHAPPPPLPDGIIACGGRELPEARNSFVMPALAADLLIVHLRHPKRIALKLVRWYPASFVPGDIHLDSGLRLEDLAALVHLSPYHFARQFKDATGMPPYQCVLNCRVQRARELLTRGELSISEVAHAVGFANQSHLTRHVKHQLGVTPASLLPVNRAVHREQVE